MPATAANLHATLALALNIRVKDFATNNESESQSCDADRCCGSQFACHAGVTSRYMHERKYNVGASDDEPSC
jgi:hypothetical protein